MQVVGLLETEGTSDHLQKQSSGLQPANMLEKALGLQPQLWESQGKAGSVAGGG